MLKVSVISPEASVFEGIRKSIVADRPAFLNEFFKNFYNLDELGGKRISNQAVHLSWMVAAGASPKGTLDCVTAWGTDFRKDLESITVPTLVIHGDGDRILPIAATGTRIHEAIKGSRFVVVAGGPHGLLWTHADNVNSALVKFLK